MSQVFASHTTPLYICFARLFVGWGIQSPVSSHPDIPFHFVEMILFHLFVTALNLYWSLQNYNARNQNRRAVGVFYVPLVVEGGGGWLDCRGGPTHFENLAPSKSEVWFPTCSGY